MIVPNNLGNKSIDAIIYDVEGLGAGNAMKINQDSQKEHMYSWLNVSKILYGRDYDVKSITLYEFSRIVRWI